MPLLEALPTGIIWVILFAVVIGFIGLRVGWVAYTEPTPRFVLHYTGWTCPPLAMLYGGIAMLLIGGLAPVIELKELQAAIPDLILGVLGLTCISCMVIFLLGFFFWFPPFLLPPWYHRARKAGVPRNDPHAMGEFKALPVEQQKTAAKNKK